MPIVLGLLMILVGFFINHTPGLYEPISGIYFDFTGFNLPAGILMIVAGVGLIWTFMRKTL